MDTILGATALVGLLLALWQFGQKLYGAWRRVDNFLDDWNGAPARPGHAAVPSIPERMGAVEQRLEVLEGIILNGNGKHE